MNETSRIFNIDETSLQLQEKEKSSHDYRKG